MKKLFFAILAAFCVFAFTACDGNDGTQATPSDDETSTVLPTQESDETDSPDEDKKEITAMYIYINDSKLEVALAENSSVDALVEILEKEDIVYTANDYGDFEKVGNIGYSLPRNDEPINTSAGDVILYQGNSICLYYGNNSWTFTRIGRINGYSVSELRTLLCAGSGSVQIRVSLK